MRAHMPRHLGKLEDKQYYRMHLKSPANYESKQRLNRAAAYLFATRQQALPCALVTIVLTREQSKNLKLVAKNSQGPTSICTHCLLTM